MNMYYSNCIFLNFVTVYVVITKSNINCLLKDYNPHFTNQKGQVKIGFVLWLKNYKLV